MCKIGEGIGFQKLSR